MQPFPETQQTISSDTEILIQVEHLSRVITTRTRKTTILDDLTFNVPAGSLFTIYEIATTLVISEGTVKMHVSNILSKLHLADRTQAAIYALQKRLVPLNEALDPDSSS